MTFHQRRLERPLRVAVIGAGISGMSAAWLLSRRHDVTVYEAQGKAGGHSNTVDATTADGRTTPVDTGFIVYNPPNYPNLTALFDHLGVPTKPAPMSFAVSLDEGALEYGTTGLGALFGQPENLIRPRFWSMLGDLVRFQRDAVHDLDAVCRQGLSLGDYLSSRGYGAAFRNDHILPQAGAIWSATLSDIAEHPAEAFIRFFDNHGLLSLTARPQWRTVDGGSRAYVQRLTAAYADRVRTGCAVTGIGRVEGDVLVRDATGRIERYDQVVIACHADQALRLLEDPSAEETRILGAFRYTPNRAVLHTDVALMPRRRATWSAWNYLGTRDGGGSVTYWMNALQSLPGDPLLVSLNPLIEPAAETVLWSHEYEHPLFDLGAMIAQRELWSLQGKGGTWFCGAYFGSGFHEDGLQAGLAVAEALGGVRRPWRVENESGRIFLGPAPAEVEVRS